MHRIPQTKHKHITWYNIHDIDAGMRKSIQENFNFHELDHENMGKTSKHPKISHHDDYISLVLHFPIYKNGVVDKTSKLQILIGENYIFTLQNHALPEISSLFEKAKQENFKEEVFQEKSGYVLYQILKCLYDECFTVVVGQDEKIDIIEENIFNENTKDSIQDILNIKREIITFRRILGLQKNLLTQLKDKPFSFLDKNLHHYFNNIIHQSEKIWDILEVHRETINALQDANEANISHHTNRVMQVLTVFSVIMLPLTFITGLFGMNVPLPFMNNSSGFLFIDIGMFAIATILLIFFYIKKWL